MFICLVVLLVEDSRFMIQSLLCPVMFNTISEKTLYLFGIANVITIPMVWAFYPESNQRTLEEMDLLFAADTPWVWDAEKTFARLVEQNPGLVQAARRGSRVVDPEGFGARDEKQIVTARQGDMAEGYGAGNKGFSGE